MIVTVNEIFKVPVFEVKLERNLPKIQADILEYLKEFPEGRTASNQGGWQSIDLNCYSGEFGLLAQELIEIGQNIASSIGYAPVEWYNAWINKNGAGHFNWDHSHPGCVLSGVFYITVPANSGEITFIHPSCDAMDDNFVSSFTPYSSGSWAFMPKENTAYFFPSWLRHRVLPNLNLTEERVSLAFNFKRAQ